MDLFPQAFCNNIMCQFLKHASESSLLTQFSVFFPAGLRITPWRQPGEGGRAEGWRALGVGVLLVERQLQQFATTHVSVKYIFSRVFGVVLRSVCAYLWCVLGLRKSVGAEIASYYQLCVRTH